MISRPFDLSQYSANDKPTLYFEYYVNVEANDDYLPGRGLQNDSFRVLAAGDDGEWQLLATNNDFRTIAASDEYDYFNETGIVVQELFDDDNNWRQARVDISPFAGNENVRLRFDVSTGGSMKVHHGSINVYAVEGDEIVDDEVISIRYDSPNDDFLFGVPDDNQIVQFQSIVGT